MHGLVSILDSLHCKMVESIWHELESECGLTGIKATPFPHFSWLIAEEFEWPALQTGLEELIARSAPLRVRTSGLGLFTGPAPVVYIPVVRTRELSDLHESLWRLSEPRGEGVSPLYEPQKWMPHISLTYGDAIMDVLPRVMEQLAGRIFNWEIAIDNVALIYQVTGQIGALRARYQLGH